MITKLFFYVSFENDMMQCPNVPEDIIFPFVHSINCLGESAWTEPNVAFNWVFNSVSRQLLKHILARHLLLNTVMKIPVWFLELSFKCNLNHILDILAYKHIFSLLSVKISKMLSNIRKIAWNILILFKFYIFCR